MGRPAAPPVIAIDLLRFGCALLVVLYHFAGYWTAPSPHAAAALAGLPGVPLDNAFTRAGAIGVELFFVISGMVIARSVVGSGWRDFLRRRVLRLAPAAWICASVTAALLVVAGQGGFALLMQWLRALTFVPSTDLIDPSYWTLAVELNFYLLVTLFAGACASARTVERLGLALGAASGAFWLAYAAGWVPPEALGSFALTLSLLPHGLFFALGIMLAGEAGRVRTIAALVFTALATIEIGAHFGDGATRGIATGLFVGGVAVLASATRLQAMLANFVTPVSARTLGLMTYPLYLLHQDAGAVVVAAWLSIGAGQMAALGLTATVMLAAAWAVAVVAEPALRRVLAAAINPRTAGPAFRSAA